MNVLGIDVGGSGIKGAIINTETGAFITERYRVDTPKPSTPALVADAISAISNNFQWKGLVGVGFPAVVRNGIVYTASNIDKSWIGTNASAIFEAKTGNKVYVLNDADAAGYAEFLYGHVAKTKGVVIVITIGTGLGTAIFTDGILVPNTEFGHLQFKGVVAEQYASDATRKKLDLTWDEWGRRFNEYLKYLEFLFSPELFILGGGASKKLDKFIHNFTVYTPVTAAALENNAGIIGAACMAALKSDS